MRGVTVVVAVMLALPGAAQAETLEVGPGKAYPDILSALARARPGDVILVHPLDGGKAYERPAVLVRKPAVTFKAQAGKDGRRVRLDGGGYDYSGRGSVPRAIFQFDPGADGCVLEGFELFGAHNDSHNGAGLRINQANNVTIRNCDIRDNDMGIMSSGNGTPQTAVNQRIENCLIRRNGNLKDPGYNHNLYLGGTSVTLSACEVHSSLTGHNVKSRAHHTRVEFCYVHDSSNREFDLVDAKGDTTPAASDAVLVGNVIVKARACEGNRGTIHFGQDGGNEHDGVIYLVHNTIVSPFISPIVDLSAPKAKAHLVNNIVWDGGARQGGQKLVAARGAVAERLSGECNWLSAGFARSELGALKSTAIAPGGLRPPFADPVNGDYRLAGPAGGIVDAGVPWSRIAVPPVPVGPGQMGSPSQQAAPPGPLFQYKHPAGKEPRPADGRPDLGAYEYQRK